MNTATADTKMGSHNAVHTNHVCLLIQLPELPGAIDMHRRGGVRNGRLVMTPQIAEPPVRRSSWRMRQRRRMEPIRVMDEVVDDRIGDCMSSVQFDILESSFQPECLSASERRSLDSSE